MFLIFFFFFFISLTVYYDVFRVYFFYLSFLRFVAIVEFYVTFCVCVCFSIRKFSAIFSTNVTSWLYYFSSSGTQVEGTYAYYCVFYAFYVLCYISIFSLQFTIIAIFSPELSCISLHLYPTKSNLLSMQIFEFLTLLWVYVK